MENPHVFLRLSGDPWPIVVLCWLTPITVINYFKITQASEWLLIWRHTRPNQGDLPALRSSVKHHHQWCTPDRTVAEASSSFRYLLWSDFSAFSFSDNFVPLHKCRDICAQAFVLSTSYVGRKNMLVTVVFWRCLKAKTNAVKSYLKWSYSNSAVV